ncbi:hypothetical protein AHF37_03364 [Paragonimus kellicotti]|nr:hypothetical protein AHF37_03364 [Paragonimus kellicotti]
MSARYSILHTTTKRLPAKTALGNDLFASCFPPEIAINWSHGGRDWKIRHLPMNQSKHTLLDFELTEASTSLQLEQSSPILTICYAHALQVLRVGDSAATVYPPSGFVVHRPDEIINQEFYAFSYIFDLAQSVGIVRSQSGEQVTIAHFRDATNRVCNNPDPNEPFQCMDLAFITALLHDGYGFPWDKKITLQTWIIASLLVVSTVLFWLSYRAHDTLRETFLANSKPYPDGPTVFRPNELSLSTQPDRIYGVVFDAGSTGSRVHVFELTRQNLKDVDAPLTLTDELFEQVHPGLSSYADNPEQAAESLQPLLKAALKRVPRGYCSNTSVVLRATAGLRLLSAQKADNILAAVRQKLSASCLLQSTNAVSILDGNLEGLYLWISLNVMTNRMPSPNSAASESRHALDHTVGTLDLGGGSTQITFAPRIPDTLMNAPDGYATAIDSGQTVRKTELKPGKHRKPRLTIDDGQLSKHKCRQSSCPFALLTFDHGSGSDGDRKFWNVDAESFDRCVPVTMATSLHDKPSQT